MGDGNLVSEMQGRTWLLQVVLDHCRPFYCVVSAGKNSCEDGRFVSHGSCTPCVFSCTNRSIRHFSPPVSHWHKAYLSDQSAGAYSETTPCLSCAGERGSTLLPTTAPHSLYDGSWGLCTSSTLSASQASFLAFHPGTGTVELRSFRHCVW